MSESKRYRPTMLDVAELSGVSYQTVSRVINNHPYVSEDTRKRVQEAIDTLGYRPSKAATKMRAKSSQTIAIILYGSWFHGPIQIALNVEMAAKTSGFDVILTNVTETHKQVKEAIQHVKDWSVDGIVMILPAQGLPQQEIQAICEDIPFVQIESQPSAKVPSITLDDARGTVEVMEHLISLGHRRFCEITGPLNWHSAQSRHQAYLRACEKYGIEAPMYIEGNWTTPGGYQATRRLLQQGQSFSALVAANDSMALGAYRALYEAGLSVPNDVSVVGFDDIPEAAYYMPALTTVRHSFIELGSMGFEYLMQLMDDPDTAVTQKVIAPKLILRDSTALCNE
jgi:DNA-binding LacI/PurR family transcriptional regulator